MTAFQRRAAGVVLSLGLGCGVVAWFVATRKQAPAAPVAVHESADPAPAPAANTNAAIGSVAFRVTQLQAQVAGLQEQLAQQGPRRPSASAAPRPAQPGEPVIDHARRVQVHYDGVFDAQPTDAAWAGTERQTIADFFSANSLAGLRLEGLDCRESMCRVRLHYDGDPARLAFMAKLGSPPFDHGAFYRADPETGQLTVFTARQGRELPGLDAIEAEPL